VELNPDDTVTVLPSWEDHGQGADGHLGTAHEALRPMGITPDQIHLVMNDTSKAPDSGPAGGSRSAGGGPGHQGGLRMLVEGMKSPTAPTGPTTRWRPKTSPPSYDGKWTAPATNCDENGQGAPFAVYMYGVFMAEVAVETATGKTTVEKMTLVADIGKVNNRWWLTARCTAAWPRASAWP
jgi:aldehyde oxidoreductase